MIIDRNGNEVNEITLDCGKWCYFITRAGAKYVITNANHKMIVTKPMKLDRLPITKEIKAANIEIA